MHEPGADDRMLLQLRRSFRKSRVASDGPAPRPLNGGNSSSERLSKPNRRAAGEEPARRQGVRHTCQASRARLPALAKKDPSRIRELRRLFRLGLGSFAAACAGRIGAARRSRCLARPERQRQLLGPPPYRPISIARSVWRCSTFATSGARRRVSGLTALPASAAKARVGSSKREVPKSLPVIAFLRVSINPN